MLELNGIDTLFCLPGVQNDSFFDALYDRTNAIRPIHTRHEQACAYMALGYAMASAKPSAYVVVPGPGFLNTTAALSTAYAVNAPVLALTGQTGGTTTLTPAQAIKRTITIAGTLTSNLTVVVPAWVV